MTLAAIAYPTALFALVAAVVIRDYLPAIRELSRYLRSIRRSAPLEVTVLPLSYAPHQSHLGIWSPGCVRVLAHGSIVSKSEANKSSVAKQNRMWWALARQLEKDAREIPRCGLKLSSTSTHMSYPLEGSIAQRQVCSKT